MRPCIHGLQHNTGSPTGGQIQTVDYLEAIDYVQSIPWTGKKLGLDRIRLLLSRMGDPQKELRFIHVAGTNGKGSICEMTASILQEAGYRVGVFVSPYVMRFNERIQVDHKQIPDNELAAVITGIKEKAEGMEDKPSFFEMITAAALQYYRDRGCDYVVLEVGMGGRLDATNVIDLPLVAVIATIGLDHTAQLGNTLPAIAYEKAGIIKEGGRIVAYSQGEEVIEVFRKRAEEMNAGLIVADFTRIEKTGEDSRYQYFRYKDSGIYALPLLGDHQLRNAATVLEAIEVLREEGVDIPQDSIAGGLKKASWPGRFEILSTEPLFIVDGGHNPEGACAAVETFKGRYPGRKAVVITGVSKGKDIQSILSKVDEIAVNFIAVQADTSRSVALMDLTDILKQFGKPVFSADSIPEGIKEAFRIRKDDEIILAVGTLYTVGEIRRYFGRE